MKKTIALLLVLLLSLSLLVGCGSKEEKKEEKKSEVIATVNGEEIYSDKFLSWYQSTFAMDMGADLTNGIPAEAMEAYEEYKLSYLYYYIQQYTVIQAFGKEGNTVDLELVDSTVDQVKSQYPDEATYQRFLAMNGFTDESFYDFISDQVCLSTFYENYTKDMEPAGDVEDFFNKHLHDYSALEQRTVRHILVDDVALATIIIDELNKGGDMEALVEKYSTDPSAATNKGIIGPFDVNGNYVQSFKDATFTLEKVGDVTQEPVESDYGYHVIRLEEVFPAEVPVLEGEFKDQVEADMLYVEKQDAFEAYTQEIIDSAEVVYSDGWDPMVYYGK